MSMNYKEIGLPYLNQYPKGVREVNDLVDSLAREGVLPKRFPKAQTREIAGGLEIPTVTEGLYLETREALAKKGYTFVVAIKSLSIGQLVSDPIENYRFGDVSPSENMRDIVPQQMEVAINPGDLRIKGSNFKSTDAQIGMIKDEEAGLKNELSQEVRDLISMRMQSASVLAQLDHEYQKETGRVLFTNWFGRTDDQTVPGLVAYVGRNDPAIRLLVHAWPRDLGPGHLFAVSTVVLPRQLAV